MDDGLSAGGDLVPQQRRAGINETALHAGIGNDKFALLVKSVRLRVCKGKHDRFQWMAGEARAKVFRPVYVKTAVGGFERVDRDAAFLEQGHPGAGGTGLRPAGAAQRQDDGTRLRGDLPGGGCEAQGTIPVPAEPRVTCVKRYPSCAQAFQPGMQERGGLHANREDTPGSAGEGINAQSAGPASDLLRSEIFQQGLHLRTARAIACEELFEGFGMGQVKPTLAGYQELASQGRLGLIQVDPQAALNQHFGGHQPAGPAADDCRRFACNAHYFPVPISVERREKMIHQSTPIHTNKKIIIGAT